MKAIGTIIREYRTAKGMTQEQLGRALFVTKQAVSKWENGKTTPDIDTLRKLADILSIPREELLGGTVREAARRQVRIRQLAGLSVILAAGLLVMSVLWFWIFVQRRMQSGVAIVTVYQGGSLLPSDQYTLSPELQPVDGQNGYSFDIDYGECAGSLALSSGLTVDFVFFNDNNWHNIQLRFDLQPEETDGRAQMTVTYRTDGAAIHSETFDVPLAPGQTEVRLGRNGL